MQFHQPGAYFHQRTIRTFIQRSRLSLVARGSSGHRQFTGKYPHNLPTRSYDKAADMGINDFTVQYIMLPVKSSSPMTLTLELMVNGESFSRTYTTPLTPPNNLLSAGNSYLFRAVINENSISFANVSVKEWTEVDESGNPLYPVQD